MSTRSLTVFKNEKEEICVLYRQWDGYPQGHGKELAEFLSGITMVNGIGSERKKIANGMGCLVAQVIAHFKTEVGNFYVEPAGTRNYGEEYTYIVTGEEGFEPEIEIMEGRKRIFSGSANECVEFIKRMQEENESQ